MKVVLRGALGSLLLLAMLMVHTGCQSTRLQEGGAYNDPVLFNADRTITGSYRILDSFLKWEHTNRPLLPPEVTQAADHVRENARQWTQSAINLREAYAANPTEETRSRLDQALTLLQAALNEALRYMAAQEQRLNQLNPQRTPSVNPNPPQPQRTP